MPCRPHRIHLAMAAMPPSPPPQPPPDRSAHIPSPLHRPYLYPHRRTTVSRRDGKAYFRNGVPPFAIVAKDHNKQRMIPERNRHRNRRQILNRPIRPQIVIDQIPRPHRRRIEVLPRRRNLKSKLLGLVLTVRRRPLHDQHRRPSLKMSIPGRLSHLYQAPEQQQQRLVCRHRRDPRGRPPYDSHQPPRSPLLYRPKAIQDTGAR